MGKIKILFKKCRQIVIRPVLRWIYKNKVGKGVEVCKQAYLTHSIIGDYCYLGMYSYFNHVEMGRYCSISGYVTIGAMEHDYTDFSTSTHLSNGGYNDRMTKIGDDVWIGAQCVIRQGVKIGSGSVIGANSFVNKDVPPYAIAFGSPARVYKYRFDEDKIAAIKEYGFLGLDPNDARLVISNLEKRE